MPFVFILVFFLLFFPRMMERKWIKSQIEDQRLGRIIEPFIWFKFAVTEEEAELFIDFLFSEVSSVDLISDYSFTGALQSFLAAY